MSQIPLLFEMAVRECVEVERAREATFMHAPRPTPNMLPGTRRWAWKVYIREFEYALREGPLNVNEDWWDGI